MHKVAFASVWLLVFSIPWENLFEFQGAGTLSRVFGMMALVIGVFATLCLNKEIRWHPFHWLMLLFVLMGGFSVFWSIDPVTSLRRVWTFLQLFMMVWLVFQWAGEVKAHHSLLKAYVLGAYVAVFSILFNFLSGVEVTWQRHAATGFNPNDVAIILVLAIPISWYVSLSGTSSFFDWSYRLYPVIAPIAIVLTGSRNGLIAMLVSLSYVIWTAARLSARHKLILLVVGAGAVYAGLIFVPPGSWERLSTIGYAFTEGRLNTRLDIWAAGIKSFYQSPLLGTGAGTFKSAVEPFLGFSMAPHNVYLAVLVELGLAGLLLFFFLLINVLYNALQLPTLARRLWIVMLITWGLSASVLNWEWRKQTWLILALAVTHTAVTMSHQRRKAETMGSAREL